MNFTDYYHYLEVSSDASQDEIKKSYRRLVRLYHPDTADSQEAEERFHQIQEAYDVLSDPLKRDEYDEHYRGFSPKDVHRTYQSNQDRADSAKSQDLQNASTAAELDEQAERRWRILQNYHHTGEDQREKPAAFHAPGTDSSGPRKTERSLFGKLKSTVGGLGIKSQKASSPSRSSRPLPAVERERLYQFTIDAYESLSDTHRELALKSGDSPRIIRVKIPAGIRDGGVLRVNCPETDELPAQTIEVRVNIVPHAMVERDGTNILLRIPVTVHEAMSGAEIEIPTMNHPVRLKLPSPLTPTTEIKFTGLGTTGDRGKRGDLLVRPYVVIPELVTEPGRQAAKLIDELYTGPVRRNIPLVLNKTRGKS